MDLSQESFSRCLWQRCGEIQQCELRMTVQRITNLFLFCKGLGRQQLFDSRGRRWLEPCRHDGPNRDHQSGCKGEAEIHPNAAPGWRQGESLS
ncbi:MAG: hypothetical protein KME69_06970 [Candidatus Thiodiazotropha sp. (ex Codakia orbicularis)]|nr:hypothetical protein [Candidatus Thiodiazotropha sp. (ex Codakia orbicularis)]